MIECSLWQCVSHMAIPVSICFIIVISVSSLLDRIVELTDRMVNLEHLNEENRKTLDSIAHRNVITATEKTAKVEKSVRFQDDHRLCDDCSFDDRTKTDKPSPGRSKIDDIDVLNGFKGHEYEPLTTIECIAQSRGYAIRVLKLDDENVPINTEMNGLKTIGVSARTMIDDSGSKVVIVDEFINVQS